MALRPPASFVTLLVLAATTMSARVAVAQTSTATPSASPSPPPGSEGLSPATIVIGLILIAGLLLFRTRMGRADR